MLPAPVLAVVPAPGPGVPVEVEEVVASIGEVAPSLGPAGPRHRQLHVQLLLGRAPHLYRSDQNI